MTEEEKLAEEYFKKTYPSYIGCDKFTEDIKDAVIYGLNARKPEWHKVADGDYPPEEFYLVLGYFSIIDGTPWNSNYVACMYGNGNWYDDCMTYIEQDREPIAWCEIPKYTEE